MNFILILIITLLFSMVFAFFIFMICLGLVVGYKTIYKKIIYDRQKLELSYNVYDEKWLKNLNIIVINIVSNFDSIPLRLYIITPKKSKITKNIVIFHHGITSNHVAGYKIADIYLKKNITFVCYDSRGWGDNIHNGFCTYGIYEKYDLLQVVKYINAKYNPDNIFLHGESMGAKSVLEYGCWYDYLDYVSGYIIDSGFFSLSSVIKYNIKKTFLYLPYWYIYPFANLYIWLKTSKTIGENNIEKYSHNIKKPILVVYSDGDTSVPKKEYFKIIKNITHAKVFYRPNAPHVLCSVFYREGYIKKLSSFLDFCEERNNS